MVHPWVKQVRAKSNELAKQTSTPPSEVVDNSVKDVTPLPVKDVKETSEFFFSNPAKAIKADIQSDNKTVLQDSRPVKVKAKRASSKKQQNTTPEPDTVESTQVADVPTTA